MKYVVYIFIFSLFFACKKENNSVSQPVNPGAGDQEIITTLKIKMYNQSVLSDSLEVEFKDTDYEFRYDSIKLNPNTYYKAKIRLFDETSATIKKEITSEIKSESNYHQFFFYPDNVDVITQYTDTDFNGKPLGLNFDIKTGLIGSGLLKVRLTHFSDVLHKDGINPNGGTDIYVEFPVLIK